MPAPARLPPVPAVHALRVLMTPRFTQETLAEAIRAEAKRRGFRKFRGPTQRAVSTWMRLDCRPRPVMRDLIEAVTLGAVPADGWLTSAERRRLAERTVARRNSKSRRAA